MHTVDLHNLNGFEARVELARSVRECYELRIKIFKISHGYGEYVLKNVTWDYLQNNEYVEKFYLAPPQLGGAGVTIVNLKNKK